jgi:serine acetyltransferase
MMDADASIISKVFRFFQVIKNSGLKTALNQTTTYIELKVIPHSGCVIGQKLPPTTTLHHPTGIVIAGDAQIGENVNIYQNVTIGTKGDNPVKYPKIGNNVTIYAGAAIIGDVTVGDGATIGANAVVVDNVPENTVVAGVPAVEINS